MVLLDEAQDIGYIASDLELMLSKITNPDARNDIQRAIGQLRAARASLTTANSRLEALNATR